MCVLGSRTLNEYDDDDASNLLDFMVLGFLGLGIRINTVKLEPIGNIEPMI